MKPQISTDKIKHKRHKFLLAEITFCTYILIIIASSGFSLTISEDFSTTKYKDENLTTADWNTTDGALTLPKNIGIVDQEWTTGTNDSGIGQKRIMAQTFTTGAGFTLLGRIDLYLSYGSGALSDITLTINEVNSSGQPTSIILSRAVIPAFSSPLYPNFAWFSVKFDPAVQVKEKTQYAIVLACHDSQTDNLYYWKYSTDSSGGYKGGSRVHSFDGGQTWQVSTYEDFMFKTYTPEVYTTAAGYVTTAEGVSLGYDTGYVSVKYNYFNATVSSPEGTGISFLFSDSKDNITFGSYVDGIWKESTWTEDITTLNHRFIRWKAILQTSELYLTPAVDFLEIDYTPQPAPLINSVSPSSGSVNGYQPITIFGDNFSSGLKVYINNNECESIKLVDSKTINALTPKSDSLGKKDLLVLNPDGQSSTLKSAYNYLPQITEDFLTETYKDSLNTTAFWNTSNNTLILPKLGGETIDQQWTGPQYSGSSIGQARVMAQSFIPGLTLLGRVDVCLTYGEGDPSDLTIKIVEVDNQGKPTSNVLGSAKINAFNSPQYPNFNWFTAVFQEPIQLKTNQQYGIVLICPNSNTDNLYYWSYSLDFDGGYQGGNRLNSFDGGKTWEISSYEDFLFKTYSPPTQYTTSSYAQSLAYDTTFRSISYLSYTVVQNLPPGTTTAISFSESDDMANWSNWIQDIKTLSKRYIRWKTELRTSDTSKTPTIDTITIDFRLLHRSSDSVCMLEAPSSDITFEVVSTTTTSSYSIQQSPTFITQIYDIGPDETIFEPSAILTFFYKDEDQDGLEDTTGLPETDLKIYVFNTQTELWEPLPNQTVDTLNNLIKAEISHLSLFAILYIEEAIVGRVDFDPRVLNLKSEGKFITAYIGLPKEFNIRDIVLDTIKISKIDDKEIEPIYEGKWESYGKMEKEREIEKKPVSIEEETLMAKFDRQKLKKLLTPGERKLTVVAQFIELSEKADKPRPCIQQRDKLVNCDNRIRKLCASNIIKVIEPGKNEPQADPTFVTKTNEPQADPTFTLGEVYSFPNPAKKEFPVLHIECGIADKVGIKIYDIAGDIIQETTLTDRPLIIDGKYAYEYRWDVSDVASGVYIYLILAEKDGYKPIKIVKKLAVIK